MGVKNNSLATSIGRLKLKNPIMVASGTFGYGEEFKDLVALKNIGAIVTKSITVDPCTGNRPPRIWETTSGMLNSIGLQNEGIDDFIANKLPYLERIGTAIVVSIAGKRKLEYRELAKKLDKTSVDAIEVNISCPNIEHGYSLKDETAESPLPRLFAQDVKSTAEIIRAVKSQTKKTVIAKLSPNVTDIVEIAKAAKRAGSDALSLINTMLGMEVDIQKQIPRLGNVAGGLSGPAIKPIALHMVWNVYKNVKLPIIGIGGIMNTEDVLEFFLCGASAVQIGTANFLNPKTTTDIIEELPRYLKQKNLKSIKDLTGKLQT